jgi:hypothetical protein
MICEVCDQQTDTMRRIDEKFHCPLCEVKNYPPIFQVTTPWESVTGNIFDPYTNRPIRGGLEMLKRCGFKLYNHKEFLVSPPKYKYQHVYTFRFFGQLRCRRIRDKRIWPDNYKMCQSQACR